MISFERNRGQTNLNYGNTMFEQLSEVDKADHRIRRLFTEGENKSNIIVSKIIPKDELFLGFTDKTFQTPVTVKYNGKSTSFGIFGQAGDGKTQFFKHLVFTQFHDRFGYKILLLDPKNDYWNLHEPQSEQRLVDILRRVDIKPRGYKASYYRPLFLNLHGRPGKEYIITFADFKSLEQQKRTEAMKEIFMIDEKTPAGRALSWIAPRTPMSLSSFRKRLDDYKDFVLEERRKAGSNIKIVSSQFRTSLEERIAQGVIGDDGMQIPLERDDETGEVTKSKIAHAATICNDLMDTNKDGIVVMEQDLDGSNSYISSCLTKMAIAQPWTDRYNYVTTDGHEGLLASPVFVGIDEADVLCPHERIKTSPSRTQINQLQSKGRAFGWSIGTISQKPYNLSQEHIDHFKSIATTRLNDERIIKIIQEKFRIEEHQLEDLRKMDYDTNEPVKEWVWFTGNPANPYARFYPPPPNVQIVHENE